MKLYNRETSYYTIITIPKCLVSKYGKKQIWRSLNTKDYSCNQKMREIIIQLFRICPDQLKLQDSKGCY